jgi:hypothetical protein
MQIITKVLTLQLEANVFQDKDDNKKCSNNLVPASSREGLLSAPTAKLELFCHSYSTPAQSSQREKAK